MTEKTIQGKPCPKCFSFVSGSAVKCSVCGFELQGQSEKTIPDFKKSEPKRSNLSNRIYKKRVITCSKCATENHEDFRFCKICKHPLQDNQDWGNKISETKKNEVENRDNLLLYLDWLKKPTEYEVENILLFKDFSPCFKGYLNWKDYVFVIYQKSGSYEFLVRKTNKSAKSLFFKKCTQISIVDSGKEFYLGAIKFQLLGDLKQNQDVKTVIKSNKTIIKGAEETNQNLSSKGRARLKILNRETEIHHLDINDKSKIGREKISNSFKISEDDLKKSGIAEEHIMITPFKGGKWLLEPFKDNPIYEEINAVPQVLKEGDIIRWVVNDRFGEFKIKVKPKEK